MSVPSDYERRLDYLEKQDREKDRKIAQLQQTIAALQQQLQGVRQAPSQ